jgi:hypothetical protein
MSNFIGGLLPTFPLSSNGLVNSLGNLAIQNVTGVVANVALGPETSAKVSGFLGLGPTALDNVAGSIITPGLVSAGQQVIGNFLSDQLVSSGILESAAGPLASSLSTLLQEGVNNLAGDLLSGLTGGGNSDPSRWFPGAGDEPDADYGGSVYTGGPIGPDVVFSIASAETKALEISTEMLYSPTSPIKLNLGESVNLMNPTANFSGAFDPANSAISPNFTALAYSSDVVGLGLSKTFKDVATFKENYADAFKGNNGLTVSVPSVSWNFICAPDEISWSSEAQVERVQMFGTNAPPVLSGSKSMRDLTLSNALVEGFSRNKTVEDKISQLEALMNFTLDTANGYVKVPVYRVTANQKIYGAGLDFKDGGYFVLKSVNVKETMRDLRGSATRATVDVSFVQVPSYQINTGRDIASQAVRGQKSILGAVGEAQAASLTASARQGLISEGSATGNGKSKAGTNVPAATSGSAAQPAPGGKDKSKPTPDQGPAGGNPEAAMSTR